MSPYSAEFLLNLYEICIIVNIKEKPNCVFFYAFSLYINIKTYYNTIINFFYDIRY